METIATDLRRADLLEEVLKAIREPVLLTDRLGTILCASRSARRLLGVRGRLEGKLLVDVVRLRDRRILEALLRDPGSSTEQITTSTRGASSVQVRLQAARAGDWVFWSLEWTDQQHEPLYAVFETLVEELSEAVVGIDRQLEVTVANRPALRLGPFDLGERLPARWGEFELAAFASSLFEPTAIHAEAIVKPKTGTLFTITGMPTHDRTRALLLIVDTSDRERREQREREFVANAAHELQTPLTAILGAVEVLEAGAADDPAARERFLRHLRRESERLIRLVETLLVLARAGSSRRMRNRPVAVRRLLEQTARRLQPPSGVTVEVQAPADLRLNTDRELLERALANLAENALKHTRSGTIVLSGRSSRAGIVLEVSDSGSGMTEDERARATDRFFRGGDRDSEGFGLGLSIVGQVAEALSGTFELDSRPGEGTVARLVLPQARP